MLGSSCAKKQIDYQKEDNIQDFMQALNQGEYQIAYDLIEEKLQQKPDNKNLLYWKAQALSGLGQIDIYKLFPVVKMRLFAVAINEWAEMEKFSKRSLELNELTILGTDNDNRDILELEKLKKELEDINNISQIEYKINESYLRYEEKNWCSFQLNISSKYFLKENTTIFYDSFYKEQSQKCAEQIKLKPFDRIIDWIKREGIRIINDRINKIEENYYKQKYFKLAVALFEAIPILRLVPVFRLPLGLNIYKSIDILNQLYDESQDQNRIAKNARNQSTLLSSYLILGSITNAINFDKVNTINDMLCSMNIDAIVQQYSTFRIGISSLFKSFKGTEFYLKNQNSLDEAEKKIQLTPDKLDLEQEKAYILKLIKFKNVHC